MFGSNKPDLPSDQLQIYNLHTCNQLDEITCKVDSASLNLFSHIGLLILEGRRHLHLTGEEIIPEHVSPSECLETDTCNTSIGDDEQSSVQTVLHYNINSSQLDAHQQTKYQCSTSTVCHASTVNKHRLQHRIALLRNHIEQLWKNGVPLAIDVYICPSCEHGHRMASQCELHCDSSAELLSATNDTPLRLLEHWLVRVDHVTTRATVNLTHHVAADQLLQNVRNFLHHSLLGVTLMTNNGCEPCHVVFRVGVPGEQMPADTDILPCETVFPTNFVSKDRAIIRVSVRSRPATEKIERVLCRYSCTKLCECGQIGEDAKNSKHLSKQMLNSRVVPNQFPSTSSTESESHNEFSSSQLNAEDCSGYTRDESLDVITDRESDECNANSGKYFQYDAYNPDDYSNVLPINLYSTSNELPSTSSIFSPVKKSSNMSSFNLDSLIYSNQIYDLSSLETSTCSSTFTTPDKSTNIQDNRSDSKTIFDQSEYEYQLNSHVKRALSFTHKSHYPNTTHTHSFSPQRDNSTRFRHNSGFNVSCNLLRQGFSATTHLSLCSSPLPQHRLSICNKSGKHLTETCSTVGISRKVRSFGNQSAALRAGRWPDDSVTRRLTCHLSTSCPGPISTLLGNFEESILSGRLGPARVVHNFSVDIGASGLFQPKHLKRPVSVLFYSSVEQKNDCASSPYMGYVSLGRKGYHVPSSGTLQVTLFNPHGTVVKMFVIVYDLSSMPPNNSTFIRQRTLYMPVGESAQSPQSNKWLRYIIHFRFATSRTCRLYLHTDLRMIIFRKFDLELSCADAIDGIKYEMRSFLHMPDNPKFSPRK